MLVRALLQTSLVLWLAQQTLQGGVKPQSVSWGRLLPARVAGPFAAQRSRYGNKAMKTGIGHYPGVQLGVAGHRSLGLGGRAGLKQRAYGGQAPYGASLGAGIPLGTGLTNGLGLGLGQAGKHAYGGGLGTLPGYGALAGNGYAGARPGPGLGHPTGHKPEEHILGVSAADLGGPELAGLGQAPRDLKILFGKNDRPEIPQGRGRVLAPAAPKLQAGGDATSLDPSSLGSKIHRDKPSKNLGLSVSQTQGGESYEPTVLKRKNPASHGGVRHQLLLQKDKTRSLSSAPSRDHQSSVHRSHRAPNCGSTRHLQVDHHKLLGPETQQSPSLVPQPRLGSESEDLGHTTLQAQAKTYLLTITQSQDAGKKTSPPPTGQGTRNHLSAAAARQGVRDLRPSTKYSNGFSIRGTITVENLHPGSLNLQAQGRGNHGAVIPSASLGSTSVGGQEAKGFAADGQEAKHLNHEAKEPKALSVPEQTGRNNQATRYLGGAGNHLGAGLGNGGYGPGLGQGAYLGGAAGNLGAAGLGQDGYPHGVGGKMNGYGEGATGYLGAAAGNGYGGYGNGNGHGDGYGAGLGYPAELTDGAENKAGKSKAVGARAFTGQVHGAFGAGLESTGGKYGAAQVPYGNGPVIPAGLEGDGGYPYTAQQLGLGAEGAKTSSKHGEQPGKYGGMNGALGNGYKG